MTEPRFQLWALDLSGQSHIFPATKRSYHDRDLVETLAATLSQYLFPSVEIIEL